MALSNAERQAAYRLRRRAEAEAAVPAPKAVRDALPTPLAVAEARNRALEEEIRHLKAELARRPQFPTIIERVARPPEPPEPDGHFNTRPFTPVPKVSPSRSSTSGRGRGV